MKTTDILNTISLMLIAMLNMFLIIFFLYKEKKRLIRMAKRDEEDSEEANTLHQCCRYWTLQDFIEWVYNDPSQYPAEKFLNFLKERPLGMVKLSLSEKQINDIIKRMELEGFGVATHLYFNPSSIVEQ